MDVVFWSQPSTRTIAAQIAALASGPEYTQLDVAVAYATVGGALELLRAVGPEFYELKKRCLVGIDWCRSDPDALTMLNGLRKSEVRIHDGIGVSGRSGCYPTLPFHPKGFIFTGKSSIATAFGSANLSRNGLTKGHEADLFAKAGRPPRDSKSVMA